MSLRLALCFLLLAFSAKSWSVVADADPSPVLDITGEKLRAGTNYYILPVMRGGGGGLTLASTSNTSSCPLDVVQERHGISDGLPLTFSPVNLREGVVRVSTDHNIKFSVATICLQSTVWKLDEFDEQTGQWFVTTGGVEGNPGDQTTSNWFQIEKYGDDYKLVFCPKVCNFCTVICSDVGIFIQDWTRRLALSDVPFRVMFKKA